MTTINRYLDEAKATGRARSVYLGLKVLANIYDAIGEHELRANVIARINSTPVEEERIIENLLLRQLLNGLEITQSQEKIASLSRERFFLISYSRLLFFFSILSTLLIVMALYLLYQRNNKIKLINEVLSLEKQTNTLEADNMRLQIQLKEEEARRLADDLTAKDSILVSKALLIGKTQQFLDNLLTELKQFSLELKSVGNRKSLSKIVKIVNAQVKQGAWEEFENLYASGNSAFVVNLLAKHPDLTPFDKRLCMLLQMNLTTKEISDITTQSARAIEMARYRLRKKFNLNRDDNLNAYLSQFASQG